MSLFLVSFRIAANNGDAHIGVEQAAAIGSPGKEKEKVGSLADLRWRGACLPSIVARVVLVKSPLGGINQD
jgi:hypothetical protein